MSADVLLDPLFCDLDGVCNTRAMRDARPVRSLAMSPIHNPTWFARMFSQEHVDRVSRICREAHVGVVIVSSWRQWIAFDVIVAAFQLLGCDAVQGLAYSGTPEGESRARATRAWLRCHPSERWAILDDTREHWAHSPDLLSRLVVPVDGLTEADVEATLAILGKDGR